MKNKKNIDLGDYTIPVGERTCIMGILNVTPDSFSDGGKFLDPDRALEKACQMVAEGADIIDIGGESSRPGAESISVEEELDRVIPVIKVLSSEIRVPLSIDTRKSEVARRAMEEGVLIVNDISALRGDADMARIIAGFDAGVILTHMKGTPVTMQDAPVYDDLMLEVSSYLSESIGLAVSAGIDPDKIIVDPGIGFGKTVEQNLVMLKELDRLEEMEKPVMVGVSRKSFIGEITEKGPENRIFGTAASFTAAIMNGAGMIRVHDVNEMRDIARVADAIAGV